MTARTRKFMKLANQFLYVLSIAMLISGSFLSAIATPAAAQNAGSIWTATGSCGSPQDENHYAVGDVVYVVYENLGPGDHTWNITYTNKAGKPEVTNGTQSGDSGCFAAWTIQPAEAGYEFKVDMGGKQDSYGVDGVIFVPAPGISIAKSITSAGPYDSVGDAIAYNILVTNTGNVALTNIVVTDPGANSAPVCPATTLAVGANMTCTALHSVSLVDLNAGSFTNTATATSTEAGPVSSSATATMAQLPALGVIKTLTPVDHFSVGQILSYTIVATNTGNVTLNAVTITDPNAVLGTCTPSNPANLAPGGTITCAATHTITIGEILSLAFSNTATATSGALSVNSTVNSTFNPSMALSKTVTSSGPYTLGDTIDYSIVATNNGNTTLHYVTVVDNNADSITCSPVSASPGHFTYLLVGQSMTCTATHVITLADMNAGIVNNTATGDSDETLKLNARASVSLTAGPAISFEKVVTNVGPFGVGDTIQYDLKLTNIGNVTINGLSITDTDPGIVMGTCTPALAGLSLDPQASATCTASHVVTLADIDAGSYVNTATGDSAQTDAMTATATVEFAQGPAFSFTKTEVSTGPYFVGDSISYSLELTNTGNVTLHNVTIADPSAVFGTCTPTIPVASLLPLAKVTCAATHVVTAADITAGLTFMNTAVGDSDETLPQNASVTVTLGIKGCMDPNATNYNPKATVSDGSCTYPPNVTPGPTVVPTLPIPATGGVVLIPVTGADLSNTLPGATLPRNLYFGGLSVFGVAMVLTGLRRKYHL